MKALQLTPEDTVATVLQATTAGDDVEVVLHGKTVAHVRATENIPYGFKICVKHMARHAVVVKYAHPIGLALQDIAPGALVHVHNIEGNRGRGDLAAAHGDNK